MTLIDAHTHIFAPAQREGRERLAARDATFAEMYGSPEAKIADAGGLLRAMDEAGMDRAVAAGFAFRAEADIREQGEYIVAAAAEEPRLIPLAPVNPALPGWEAWAGEALARGVRGFGELRPQDQGWDPLGAAGDRLCALAAEAGAVLLWHVSEPVGHAYPGKAGGITPVELCLLAAKHPGTKMIAAHLGGGLSFYLQMPEVRATLQNVWFDTAASELLYDDDSVSRLVDLAGPGRVLFGSDYPLQSPRRQLQRLQALLPGKVAFAVCGGNADTLFSDRHHS
ncbi:MAG: amidohydrolase family protein [Chloroflexi bacterium]|nr:amidohydrolase family protein [Chloroflexota bacterium]